MVVHAPISGRARKPRRTGLTMVIDKGLGLYQLSDLLATTADFIDFLKFGFGTAVLYRRPVLARKLALLRAHEVCAYPGGTLLEAAVLQGKAPGFLRWCRRIGFRFVEVSDGTIDLPSGVRRDLIHRARDAGFGVLTEVGKKDPRRQPEAARVAEQVEDDLDAGAWKVIIEARDSGRGVGIYDEDGRLKDSLYEDIVRRLRSMDDVIWEAPDPLQQRALLLRMGPNANFGNVQPAHVMSLEAMRVGLRGDTLSPPVRETPLEEAGIRQTV